VEGNIVGEGIHDVLAADTIDELSQPIAPTSINNDDDSSCCYPHCDYYVKY